MSEVNKEELEKTLNSIKTNLDDCVSFWTKYSHDDVHKGFFQCLETDGTRYDETKYGWMNGRQVWTYAYLYNEFERFHTPEILDAAKTGCEFLQQHIKNPETGRCYFSVTRDGKSLKLQRTIFTECFYVMALSELGKATGEEAYKKEAEEMMDRIVHWVMVDDSGLGKPVFPNPPPPSKPLAVPMMVLCLMQQMQRIWKDGDNKHSGVEEWCVKEMLEHVQRDGSVVLEHVSQEGKQLPGSVGRLMNPGHAIEGGWFLLLHAQATSNEDLAKTAMEKFMINPFITGWDADNGGILYFQDVDGHPPLQLEAELKLFWPHSEALISFLMAFCHTKEKKYWDLFQQVMKYTWDHFVDEEQGEWFGYLTKEGQVKMQMKGGPFKGCFHVPRCLALCEKMLQDLLK